MRDTAMVAVSDATATAAALSGGAVCGIAVAASAEAAECDNSIQGPSEPVESRSGIPLVEADTTGAFECSVCGVAVGPISKATAC